MLGLFEYLNGEAWRGVLIIGGGSVFLIVIAVGGLFFPEAMKRWEDQGGPGHRLLNYVWMWRFAGVVAAALLVTIAIAVIVSLIRR